MNSYKTAHTSLTVVPNTQYGSYFVIDSSTNTTITAFCNERAAVNFAAACPTCPHCNRILTGAFDTNDHRAGTPKFATCYGHR